MKPWEVLGTARAPDGTELTLTRHPTEYLILADGAGLMSSRRHSSEDALATLGCVHARTLARPSVLVGGLGMGFTLRAALDVLPAEAIVVVSELVPEVVEWNRGPLGALANHPLDDPRVRIEGDVVASLRSAPGRFDAVLLDVDNGPDALTVASNSALYGVHGIMTTRTALTPGGVLALWSVSDDRGYERRLRTNGFIVRREHVRSHQKKGSRHTIVIAQRPLA